MSARRRLAVSYSRFSDPKQSDGDSADRQEREYRAFCERHNLTPGKEIYADRGRSGYHGTHRTKGRLGQLIEAAKDGRFDPGTIIVIEAWDRLGRLRPDRQTELVAELLRTGVSIGICRLNEIFGEEDFGTHKWTTLSVFVQLAHQESKQKAERVAASWASRRQRARESGTMLGCRPPAWVELVDGKPRLIPERAAVVKRMFKLAADGFGHARIVRTLTAEKVKPFGEKVVKADRTRSQFSGRWSRSYVALLLRDRRVVGEFQPMKADKPDGPALAGFYPAAVTEDEWNRARAAQGRRLGKDTRKRAIVERDSRHVNVFRGLLTHARDGQGFVVHNKGTTKNPDPILVNASGVEGRTPQMFTFPYPVFEEHVLRWLKEIDPKTILPRDARGPSKADTLRVKLANVRADMERLRADLAEGYSKALADVLRQVEATEEQVANDLQDELARTAKPLTKTWADLPTLIDVIRKAPDPDEVRLKLRPTVRVIVESAHVLIVPCRAWRACVVQFDFVGGARRHWIIYYRPAANRRPVFAESASFANSAIPGADLRDQAAVAKLETLLMKHMTKLADDAERARRERAKAKTAEGTMGRRA
jgi:DNA invertase Pin-like site-specific DNA recombinase